MRWMWLWDACELGLTNTCLAIHLFNQKGDQSFNLTKTWTREDIDVAIDVA